MKPMNRVYFIGALPRKGKTPVGGGEVGNLRTVRMLASFGYRVSIIRKRRSQASESKLRIWLMYPLRFLVNVLACFFVLLFGNRKQSLVHISGFYGPTIPIETVQVFITKLMGYRLLYEMRGGGAEKYYATGSKSYQRQFRYLITKADVIFSQGKENEPFLKGLCQTPVYHYPNCVQRGFYPDHLVQKPSDCINLLYFGRVEPEKHPDLIVEAASLLQKQFADVRLTIVGNGQEDYLSTIKQQVERLLQPGSYQLSRGCAYEQLPAVLKDQHFYVFPSTQPREGQSNAVTEAMSFGIIPIASGQGFNRSTIGDDALIVEELTATAYADRMATLIREGSLNRYSERVYRRFCENYTEEVVFERMATVYHTIMQGL